MSLSVDGVWKAGVWATTVWADGVWFEGSAEPPAPPPAPAAEPHFASVSVYTSVRKKRKHHADDSVWLLMG